MKRLLNNKGSALFMVFSVMTVLIIAATGVFCAVSANRKNTDNHYEGEQAYQTAYSVSDAVSKYIDSYLMGIMGKEASSVSNELVKNMLSMPKFEPDPSDPSKPKDPSSIITTTSGTDMASLDNLGMGKYAVEIKKTNMNVSGSGPDEKTEHTFEIKTTADVNGEKVTITECKTIVTGPTSYFTRMFTSTGGSSQDVSLSAQSVYTPLYLENDYSSVNGKVFSDIVSSGTLDVSSTLFEAYSNITVAYNLFSKEAPNAICENGGNICVGRDFECYKTMLGNANTEVFVLGNFTSVSNTIKAKAIYVKGDVVLDHVGTIEGTQFYIDGNLTILSSNNINANGGVKFYLSDGAIVVGEDKKGNAQIITGSEPWPESGDDGYSKCQMQISVDTAKQNYATWDAEAKCKNAAKVVKATIQGGYVEINDENAVIESSNIERTNIYINAATHDLYIYLKPDASGNFSFTGNQGKVMVDGKYSVIFVLPSNANFVQNSMCYVGHIGWLCRIQNKTVDVLKTSQDEQLNEGVADTIRSTYANETTGIIDPQYVKADGTNGNSYYLHNNIFLITKGKTNTISFAGSKSTFMGFVYCKDIVFTGKCDSDFKVGGGIIAGTYEFANANTSSTIFIKPYDYYGTHEGNPDSLIKILMSSSLNVSGSAIVDAGTIGYK